MASQSQRSKEKRFSPPSIWGLLSNFYLALCMFPGKAPIRQHPEFSLQSPPPRHPSIPQFLLCAAILPVCLSVGLPLPQRSAFQTSHSLLNFNIKLLPSLITQGCWGAAPLAVARGHHSIPSWPHRALSQKQPGRSVSQLSSRFCHSSCALRLTISCKTLLGQCCARTHTHNHPP